ncbi:MAG: AbrB/MazE/SpoVT family DNA-binding domain-containing protein [Treponematales bacterium]
MLVSVIQIGDSKGVRLPEQVVNALHIKESVDMRVSDNAVVLRPAARPREPAGERQSRGAFPRTGWEEAFADMHTAKEDRLLIADALDDSAFEWEW